ncbi:AAA family ATPase [Elstera sp.]|jgi:hypothetical protein|uniref:AAA family ATPase n=1 Tax=Elstera sp. TaxID=1916664 RepID=UPI0037BFC096
MLKKLSLKGVGPAPEMEVEFAERLTVITGDNGLGKSFILDAVWFALTGKPFGEEILPTEAEENSISLEFKKVSESSTINTIVYKPGLDDESGDSWGALGKFVLKNQKFPTLYLGCEGRIGVYEPFRRATKLAFSSVYGLDSLKNGLRKEDFNINNIEVNIGGVRERENLIRINGYIYDLMIWFKDKSEPYHQMQDALKYLSSEAQEFLSLSPPSRINIQDLREIPHIVTSSGVTPITHASAGVQRIVSLAYIIVWLWQEHKLVAKLTKKTPARNLVLLIDEIETHLHPKWQRKILAAVLEVAKAITEDEGFQVQVICTTHSPIVLTGIEPHFDPEKDKLLDLQLTPGVPGERGTVELREVEFRKFGTVGKWLGSPMFEVPERSQPQEEALAKREALFEMETPGPEDIAEVEARMTESFAPDDPELAHWDWLARREGWRS